MRIPYVIDNQSHVLATVLSGLLAEHKGRSLDVATAYFTVGGFGLVKDGLSELGSLRLLLGAEPVSGEHLGLRPDADAVKGLIRKDMEVLPFDEKTLRLVEDLIAYLRRESMQVRLFTEGFLHAKCWLFYSDRPGQQALFDRFRPIVAIVGSSNFTAPGLTSNRELNLSHKVLIDPTEVEDDDASRAVSWLAADRQASPRISGENRQLIKSEVGARAIIELESWYERQWRDGRDFKDDLIRLLDESKFGRREYTPFQIYMKALYEYFKDDLDAAAPQNVRSAVELSEFQEDAVKKARKILSRYDGVMIADSVGLGKTWIGKKLLEDYAYHMRQKALVVCPASLRDMWERELCEAGISTQIVSQEELGRDEFDPGRFGDVDVLLIDESHNFRSQAAQRYANLERIIGANRGRGRDNMRKKLVLLTATPINNDLFDLYNQIMLIAQGDRAYFSASGIGDLNKYFLKARRESHENSGALALYNLLDEIVIRRTRPFIRKAYPEATIQGQKIQFPERRLKTVTYDLEATYARIYDTVVRGIESLKLAPYNLETYKKRGVEKNAFEAGREEALVGIFKSRYLKRFESSVDAFRISVKRALAFLKTFEAYILDGKLLRSGDFRHALQYLSREDDEDDATPSSMADEIDASDEARGVIDGMEPVDIAQYDLRRLHGAVQHDIDVLTAIWTKVKDIGPGEDAKLQRLKKLLAGELNGKKVLVFSYYRDTVRYLYRQLGHPDESEATAFRKKLGNVTIRRMDSGADSRERARLVQGFAPKANKKPELAGTDREIDILVSTDVLSEGQNLQDCGHLVNYDLHWNPTRMVQRAGRIDRIGTEFDTLAIYNVFPEEGLERLLKLVESLSKKIADIDRAGFLDASVLGETVHPKNFNTLRRIKNEDGTVLEEEERFAELASNEFLLQQLRMFLASGGQETIDAIPDGVHSGLLKERAKGVFFYFQAGARGGGRHHFWKYLDLKDGSIVDNRFMIANLISCAPDTARIVDPAMFGSVFDNQESVIADLLAFEENKRALDAAPRSIDPVQQGVATALQSFLNHPDVDRAAGIQAIRYLNAPMMKVQLTALKKVLQEFKPAGGLKGLLAGVRAVMEQYGAEASSLREDGPKSAVLARDDLRLVCFDFVSG
ncbi:MAG: helicase [Deltaproteobacteria bacterium]|nr:helicase [Deltaproteobacteria bacterium]